LAHGGLAALVFAPAIFASSTAAGEPLRAESAAAPRPTIVVRPDGRDATPARLSGRTIASRDAIGLTNEQAVHAATFFVGRETPGREAFAVDRSAPFVVPRRGRTGDRPYALGAHALRVELQLTSGRRTRLLVRYTVANTLEVPSTVDASTLLRSIGSRREGPLLVRPADGAEFTVVGHLTITRKALTLQGAEISGIIDFMPGSDGSALLDGGASGFGIFGTDDITLRGNVFDGHGRIKDNQVWDQPAGNTPDRFRIIGNTFRNYYDDRTEDVHSQAIYIGYSTDGLVEGNRFTDNGSTGHIFVSYFGDLDDPSRSIPRDICIRSNWFGPTHGAYEAVNLRQEIPPSSGVDVTPSNVAVRDVTLVADRRFLRNC
jgi:hypothetical protein